MNQKIFDEKRLKWNWNSICKQLNEIYLNVFDFTKKKIHEKKIIRRETIKNKQFVKNKIIVSSIKQQFVVVVSFAKKKIWSQYQRKKLRKKLRKRLSQRKICENDIYCEKEFYNDQQWIRCSINETIKRFEKKKIIHEFVNTNK